MTTILSWNVNGLRAALKNGFMEWFSATRPDVLCLQETRVMPNELDAELLAPHGYSSYWNPAQKKGYSGTGMYARVAPRSVILVAATNRPGLDSSRLRRGVLTSSTASRTGSCAGVRRPTSTSA